MPEEPTRITDYAFGWARETPDAVAVTGHVASGEASATDDPGGHARVDLTYADLVASMDAWAGYLLGAGVTHGDRVALCTRPTPQALVVYLAAASIGAVFQGLNPAYTADELRHVLHDATPSVVLDAVGGPALEVAADLALPHLRPLADARAELPAPGEWGQPALDVARDAVRPRDAAFLVHTSGSTGRPKGALIPHDALVLAGRVHARRWAGSRTTTLCPFPLNHLASLSDIFGTALVAGGRTVVMDTFDPARALELLVEERVTFWGFIPAAAELMTRQPGWGDADLSALEHTVWGGGAISETLLKTLRAKGLRPEGCYGSTETVGNVCFTDPAETDDSVLARTIGWPDEAYDARLAADSGELLIRTPTPFLGYLGRPDATAASFTEEGWLRTGDVAAEADDGSLSLVGRVHEMYKSGGYNVYPREVELALERLPAVRQAAVVAVPDPLYGEVGHAFVVLAGAVPGEPLEDVRQWLAPYKVPKQLTVVDALPLLPVGKVDKPDLLARALG